MRSFFITYYSYVYSNSNYAYSNIVHRRLLRVVWYPHSAVVIRGTLWLGWSSTSQELFEYALPHSDVTMLHATMHTRWTAYYLGSTTCVRIVLSLVFKYFNGIMLSWWEVVVQCMTAQLYSIRIELHPVQNGIAQLHDIQYVHTHMHQHTCILWLRGCFLLYMHAARVARLCRAVIVMFSF